MGLFYIFCAMVLTLVNEYLIREASTEKSLKIRTWCWGPRGELSNIKCVIRLSRYPAHAQTLLQHIHTERSAFAQSPRTSCRSQNTLNPVFLCFNIYSNLHGSTSTFIKIQFDVLGQFLADLMVERWDGRFAVPGSGWRARDILVGGF